MKPAERLGLCPRLAPGLVMLGLVMLGLVMTVGCATTTPAPSLNVVAPEGPTLAPRPLPVLIPKETKTPSTPEDVLPPPKPSVLPLSGGTTSAEDQALLTGDLALEAGDLIRALRAYETARTLAPKAAAPLVGIARMRIAQTDVALDYGAGKGNADILAARTMLKRAVAIEGSSAAAAVELGRAQLLLGDADGALESLRRGIALAPNEAEAHSVLGVAQLATGHVAEALTELQAAASLDRGSAARHGNLGTAYLMSGKVGEAVKEYELEVRLADGDARAHSDLGTALLAGGDAEPGRAVAELRRALTLDPSRATFHSNLGYALELEGSVPEAIAEYRKALALDVHLASAWINLATALAKDPKTRREARNALSQAKKIDPTDPRVKANEDELDALEHSPAP